MLSQFYAPEPEGRVHLLAEGLARRGHEVTVITGFPNYPGGKVHAEYPIRWRRWEARNGVRVLRVPLYPSHDRSVVRRSLNYLSFASSATALGTTLGGPADVLWAYHPPLTIGIPTLTISRARRVPFVLEIQDLWPETLAATGMLPSKSAARVLAGFAMSLYRRAAAITVVSPGFKRNLQEKGVPASKIEVFYNWADDDVYKPLPADADLARSEGMAGFFNVVFGGNLGAAQGLDAVLDAARLLQDLTDLRIVLIGDGIELSRLRARTEAEGISNVRFLGRKPFNAMPDYFALADVLLLHLRRDPLFEITIPAKTFPYLACGRPVIAAVPGDTSEVVQAAGAGLTCAPEDPAALAATIRAMYEASPEQRRQWGESARSYYEQHHARERVVDRYAELFARVAERGNGS